MLKFMLISICVIWLGMFLAPVIAKFVRAHKKGNNDDEA